MSAGKPRGPQGLRLAVRAAGAPIRYSMIALVRVYQLCLSPLVGPRCKFYPSCSEYSVRALAVHGAVKGLLLSVARICRCHPWQAGGVNPVPPAGSWRADVDLDGRARVPTDSRSEATEMVGV